MHFWNTDIFHRATVTLCDLQHKTNKWDLQTAILFHLEVLKHMWITTQTQHTEMLDVQLAWSRGAETYVIYNTNGAIGTSGLSVPLCTWTLLHRLPIKGPGRTPPKTRPKPTPNLPLAFKRDPDLVPTLCRTLCGPCANDRAKMEALFKSCCDARPGPTAGGPPPSPTTQIHRYLHSDGHLGAHWLLADGGGGMKWVVAWLGWWSG